MLECYSYERFQGNLLSNLEKNLKSRNVQFRPKTTEELWNDIAGKNSNILIGLIELITTIINLIKSNGYTIDDVKRIIANNRALAQNSTIISLIEPIFVAYQAELKNNNEIDFNDMINLSTSLVKDGKYVNPYNCVIVDEYQDISKARFNLLKALRDSKDYSLFCVGDDWQSIYRFTGSDLDYILKFSKYWGETEYSRIETTYRFTERDLNKVFSYYYEGSAKPEIIDTFCDTSEKHLECLSLCYETLSKYVVNTKEEMIAADEKLAKTTETMF